MSNVNEVESTTTENSANVETSHDGINVNEQIAQAVQKATAKSDKRIKALETMLSNAKQMSIVDCIKANLQRCKQAVKNAKNDTEKLQAQIELYYIQQVAIFEQIALDGGTPTGRAKRTKNVDGEALNIAELKRLRNKAMKTLTESDADFDLKTAIAKHGVDKVLSLIQQSK